jgi:plasmid maintenance system killer protein
MFGVYTLTIVLATAGRGRKRAGQMSIRINDQWRICFRWVEKDAEDVEIVDYH